MSSTLVCPTCGGKKSRRARQCRTCAPSGGARPGAGRPRGTTNLTDRIRDGLCGFLERGHTIEGATGLVGVPISTYRGWIERGNEARVLRDQAKPIPEPEQQFLVFVDSVELARNHGEGWLFEQLLDAASGEASDRRLKRWQAYMTALERTRSDRWRRRSSAEFTIPKDAPAPGMFTFDPEKLTNEELDELGVLLAKAAPRED